MLSAIGTFFCNYFFGFFNFLLMLVDFDSLEVAATKSGDNPIYGYIILMFMAASFVVISTIIVGQVIWESAKYLYKKEMEWRKYKARNSRQPIMSAKVIKSN